MKALVTGGAGFIGSTLVDRLLGEGHEVWALDNLVTGSLDNLVDARTHGDRFHFIEADLRDTAVVDQIGATGVEVVFHLAAQADVRVSVDRTAYDAEVNVLGSINAMDGARAAGARKVVFASSGGTIYGDPRPEDLPINESHPQKPLSPYGVAKMVVGHYLASYQALHGLEFTALALANVYGPRQDPHGEAGVIAIFTGLLLEPKPCTIFGDGEQTRDFIYVDDVVDAFARAAAAGPSDGQLINVGTGEEVSVNRLYEVMSAAAGIGDPAVYKPARAGELERSVLDASKAGRLLDWKPQVDLETGIGRVIDWFRARA
ncbi:MAG: GDP-mannose 4,6-dehydratase [Actinomycetota bacterium]|nr:GDP-mannose 4,6-dehydratase [Actinomycetota bacterium]